MTLVDVVVVNWNAGEQLSRCVAALDDRRGGSAIRVIVVDNASSDQSADDLHSTGTKVTVCRNSSNLGFGRACNQGAGLGRAPAILFLNPDTVPSPDAVLAASAFLGRNARTGIVGVRLTNAVGNTQRSTARRPTPRSLIGQSLGFDRIWPQLFPPLFDTAWDHADTRPVDQVMGAFLMIRRGLFEQLGGFDERFFVYFEDVDICVRVREAGFDVVHLAEQAVEHAGQGTTRRIKDRRLFYFLRSRMLFVAKHHGRWAGCLQLATDLLLHVPIRIAISSAAGSPRDAFSAARAGIMLLRASRTLLRDIASSHTNPRGGPSRPDNPSATPRSNARAMEQRPPEASQ